MENKDRERDIIMRIPKYLDYIPVDYLSRAIELLAIEGYAFKDFFTKFMLSETAKALSLPVNKYFWLGHEAICKDFLQEMQDQGIP